MNIYKYETLPMQNSSNIKLSQYENLPIWIFTNMRLGQWYNILSGEEHAHTDYQVLVIDKMRLKHWTEHLELSSILADESWQ